MSWRIAGSLDKLLKQIDAMAPLRNRASDGGIGDTDHSNRNSDHNPWCGPGVVTARDFTHDPANGADMNKVAEALRRSKDPRIKYVIWNKRIFSRTTQPWVWRAYTGTNPHDKHLHVSVECNASKDDTRPWSISRKVVPKFRIRAVRVKNSVVTGWKKARERARALRKRGFKVRVRRRGGG